MRLTKAPFAAALLACCHAAAAAAQEPKPSPSPQAPRYEETVEVEAGVPSPSASTVATKLLLPTERLPLGVSSVPGRVLEAQQARVLGDALENVPGVYAATGFGVFDFFTIRGFDSLSSALVLVDGAGEPESSFYHLYNVGRVEVLRGPAAYLYGGSALAGTVNLVRKQPGPGRFGEARLSGGSFETLEGQLDANYAPEGKGWYRLSGMAQAAQNYRDYKKSRVYAVNPAASWRLGERTPLTVNLEYVDNSFKPDIGLPIVGGLVPDVPRTRSFQTPYDRSEQVLMRGRVELQTGLGSNGTLRDKFYFTDLDWKTDGTLFNGAFPGFAGDFVLVRVLSMLSDRQKLIGNQLEASWNLGRGALRHTFLAGFETSVLRDDFTLDVAPLPVIGVFDPYETAEPPFEPIPDLSQAGDTRALVYAPYLLEQLVFRDRLQLLAGARYDSLDYRDDVSGTQRSDGQLSPLLGLLYAVTPRLSLYGNFGKAFAPPSSLVVGEREPERTTQYEAGAKARLWRGRVSVAAAAFQVDKRDMAIPDETGLLRQTGSARSRGVELEAQAQLRRDWSASASYAFTDATLTEFAERVTFSLDPPIFSVLDRSGNRMPFAPRNVFNLWSQAEWKHGLGAGAGARYVCTQFIAEDNDFKIGQYWLFDAAFSYKRKSMTLRLNLKNFGNRKYYARGYSNQAVIPANPFAAYGAVQFSLGSRP